MVCKGLSCCQLTLISANGKLYCLSARVNKGQHYKIRNSYTWWVYTSVYALIVINSLDGISVKQNRHCFSDKYEKNLGVR